MFALALRAAEFVLSVIRGHGVELLWLAALLLAAVWPLERKPDARETFARCLDRERGADEHPRTSRHLSGRTARSKEARRVTGQPLHDSSSSVVSDRGDLWDQARSQNENGFADLFRYTGRDGR